MSSLILLLNDIHCALWQETAVAGLSVQNLQSCSTVWAGCYRLTDCKQMCFVTVSWGLFGWRLTRRQDLRALLVEPLPDIAERVSVSEQPSRAKDGQEDFSWRHRIVRFFLKGRHKIVHLVNSNVPSDEAQPSTLNWRALHRLWIDVFFIDFELSCSHRLSNKQTNRQTNRAGSLDVQDSPEIWQVPKGRKYSSHRHYQRYNLILRQL